MHSCDYAVGNVILELYRLLRTFGEAGAPGIGAAYLLDERDVLVTTKTSMKGK